MALTRWVVNTIDLASGFIHADLSGDPELLISYSSETPKAGCCGREAV